MGFERITDANWNSMQIVGTVAPNLTSSKIYSFIIIPSINIIHIFKNKFCFLFFSAAVSNRTQVQTKIARVNRDINDLISDAISRESLDATCRHCRELDPDGNMAECLRGCGYLSK